MNAFLNPVFLTKIVKSYLSDVDRVWRYDFVQLKKFQDKALRKIVRYAYTVPLYHKKYKEYGIHPDDIRGTRDIEKLPLITKDDLRRNYPDKIIPKKYNKKNGFVLSTSGSTGKPVFVYIDLFSAIKGLIGFARELKAFGGDWRKSKAVLIMDIAPGSVEHASFTQSITPFLKKFISLDNIKFLHVGEKAETLLKILNEFQPEFLGSDPNMLRKLAYLKNNGRGENINPVVIFSGGAMLDKYTKNYVKNVFGVKIYDTYGTTEGGPLAFECIEGGGYHVNSDFVYLEFLDDEDRPVPYGKVGKLVVTKLYGEGTPIIRYTGIEDFLVPIESRTSCGITSEMIKHIEGRSIELIISPSGKMIAPLAITAIPAAVMDKYKTYKIKQFQIIQHKIDEVEILVVIDEKLRNIGPSKGTIFKELKKRFTEEIGNDVNIVINETDEIEKDTRADNVKVVISKIKKKER